MTCQVLNLCNIERLLRNLSDSCNEIISLYGYGGSIVFTDSKDRKIKTFSPLLATVKTLMGNGQEGTADGTEKNCTFTQVHGICSLQNTIFVSDRAAGTGGFGTCMFHSAKCPSFTPSYVPTTVLEWCTNDERR